MLLEPGARILACHRRLFPEDSPRFFIGTVVDYEAGVLKVSGLTWTRDAGRGFQKKRDPRTKVISLHAGTVIVYELPKEIDIGSLHLEQPSGTEIVLSDDAGFQMDLSERIT